LRSLGQFLVLVAAPLRCVFALKFSALHFSFSLRASTATFHPPADRASCAPSHSRTARPPSCPFARPLLTARTEDWNFLKTVLFYFLRKLNSVKGAGDESGLGRQICWEAAQQFSYKFLKVNFASKKHDLGFALMNQLSVAEKRFPKSEHDIAADFFALRKSHTGTRCVFSEGRNSLNPNSHCDIAWAGALSTHAHAESKCGAGGMVVYDHWDGGAAYSKLSPEAKLLWSDDPAIWRPWC
jgi:hypothetical protein